MPFDPDLPAIKAVLSAYRSTEAVITEEQITAAWEEFAAVSEEHEALQRRKKWPPEHMVAANEYARRLVAEGYVAELEAYDVEQVLVAAMEERGERQRQDRAKQYVDAVRAELEGDANA